MKLRKVNTKSNRISKKENRKYNKFCSRSVTFCYRVKKVKDKTKILKSHFEANLRARHLIHTI